MPKNIAKHYVELAKHYTEIPKEYVEIPQAFKELKMLKFLERYFLNKKKFLILKLK